MKMIRKMSLLAVGVISMALVSCSSSSAKAETEQEEAVVEEVAETATDTSEAADTVVAINSSEQLVNYIGKGKPVIVDFWATWCGPCMKFKPVFHEVAEKYAGKVIFATVDVDECPDLSKAFDVTSIPTVSVILNDGSMRPVVGAMSEEEFTKVVDGALAGKLPSE